MESIFSTAEADAWSRGFPYEEYLSLADRLNLQSARLSRKAYALLCQSLDQNLKDFNSDSN